MHYYWNDHRCEAKIWFKRFSEGDTNLFRKKGFGRPSIVNSIPLLKAVEKNPTINTRKLLMQLEPSKSTIGMYLHLDRKVNRHCQEVCQIDSGRRYTVCGYAQRTFKNPFDSHQENRNKRWELDLFYKSSHFKSVVRHIILTAFPVV